MANPSLDLNYGHVGQSVYDLENSAWNFDRLPGHNGGLRQLGSWKTAISPITPLDCSSGRPLNRTTREAGFSAKALSRNNPELYPSLPNLPKEELISAAIVSTAETYDPAIGNLLAVGSSTADGRWRNAKRVAALPCGVSGSVLRLVALTKEKSGWESEKNTWVQGYSFAGGESGYWAEDGAPVQGLSFAQSDDRCQFLAARFSNRTVVFRPFHTESRKLPNRSCLYELPPSKIDTHPIASISIEQTGGVPHADVTFNAGYQRQMGLIDQLGNWSVWDIDGGYKTGSKYTLSLAIAGTVTHFEAASGVDDESAKPHEDGWARMLWVGNVNTIFICTRRRAALCDIRGNKSKRLRCSEIVPSRSADWILDVQGHPQRKTQFFILTSSRILLMDVQCISDSYNSDAKDCGARILLSIPHSRGLEDISLQCHVAVVHDETMLLLYSRLNTLITLYRLQQHETGLFLPYASCDPSSMYIDDTLNKKNHNITALQLSHLKFSGSGKVDRGPGAVYQSRDIQFYRLSVMLSDFSVHETVLHSLPAHMSTRQKQFNVEPFEWRKVIRSRFGVISVKDRDDVDDDFVVPDGLETVLEPRLGRAPGRSSAPKFMTGIEQPQQTVDYQHLYEIMVKLQSPSVPIKATITQRKPISEILERVETVIETGVGSENFLRKTIMELAPSGIDVPDVDQACLQLQTLLCIEQRTESNPRLRFIAGRHLLDLRAAKDQDPTVSSLYDDMLENWIGPLPRDLPVRVRQAKERLARVIATEVMLSSIRLRIEPPRIEGSHSASQDSGIALPILPSRPLPNLPAHPRQSTSLPPDDAKPPLPEEHLQMPGYRPSSPVTVMSETSLSAPPAIDPITRLSQHLEFDKSSAEVPANIARILAHWTPGADPNTYDWEAMARLDEMYEEDVIASDEELSQREREKKKQKQQRRAERLRKRQRRELEIGKARAESQPAMVREAGGIRSSPARAVGMGTSSQIHGGSQSRSQSQPSGIDPGVFRIVQSQAEPGRHGRRLHLGSKKKGKERMSGF